MLSNPLPDRAIYPSGPVFRLTVENYHEMIAAGILTPDDKVELLEGALICKMSHNPPHRTAILKLQRVLPTILPANTFPQFQLPITLADSEPEPDGAIIFGTIDEFANHHPRMPAVGLVIEISDSSLQQDRLVKRRIYAAAGIPVYWIVNLVNRTVEVHTGPALTADGHAYQPPTVFRPGSSVPVMLSGAAIGTIAVDSLLP